MNLFKNVASQKIYLFAYDYSTGAPKTGDAANITAYVAKDYGAVTVLGDTSATEMDSTNAKGWYMFDLTQAETNGDQLLFTAKSATANVTLVGIPIATVPPLFTSLSVDANGRVDVIKLAGTTQTARDIGASVLLSPGTGTGQLDITSGVVKSNLVQFLGTLINETAGQISAAFSQFFNVASPTGTMKAITNVVTATNLTNAPTVGDLTATMKASVTTAATAAAPIAASVAGNVVGSVGSVVGLTAANLDVAVSTRLASASYATPLDAAGTRAAIGLATANLDTQLDALPTAAEIVTAIQAVTATVSEVADGVLSRDLDNAEGTAAVHSLLSACLKLVSRFNALSGNTYRTNGTTVHMTQTPTTNPAMTPIEQLGVAS